MRVGPQLVPRIDAPGCRAFSCRQGAFAGQSSMVLTISARTADGAVPGIDLIQDRGLDGIRGDDEPLVSGWPGAEQLIANARLIGSWVALPERRP
jgi:hypothetical protein